MSINNLDTGIVSPLYLIFRIKDGDKNFYEQYFKTSLWHNYLKSNSNNGARFDRMNILKEDFMDMPVPMIELEEQQKIVSCLLTIDNQIKAQTQKIDQLKLHKKGLMQGLFPNNL